jgi:lincosamide nucleotidyltransferase A/C/D/E
MDEPAMTATDVLQVTAALEGGRVDAWIAGGWAIDALVGEQTRSHRDLDLAVRSEHLERALEILSGLALAPALDLLPVRLVMAGDGGRSVDLHPVTFDRSGHGRQSGGDGRVFDYPPDGFATGTIEGVRVPCLSAEQLVRFHLGYEPLEHDRRDMAVLRDRLGIAVPPPY